MALDNLDVFVSTLKSTPQSEICLHLKQNTVYQVISFVNQGFTHSQQDGDGVSLRKASRK